MFDCLPSVGHATVGNLGDTPIAQFPLHRPGIFIAVEVTIDELRQAQFGESETDL
ncbi:hypothetical protein HJB52_29375 [Rhizobium lentis]|nr:hypothetical protein [Rhizobium lentis]